MGEIREFPSQTLTGGTIKLRLLGDFDAPATLKAGTGIVFAIEHENGFVGCIDVKRAEWLNGNCEIGYWTMPGHRSSSREPFLSGSRSTFRPGGLGHLFKSDQRSS